jgi:hypothetical protein
MSTDHAFVCDLTQAPDSVTERLAAYRDLFAAMVDREDRDRGFRFRFAADRVDLSLLRELVARERACCAFLTSSVTTEAGQVWWDCDAKIPDAVPFLEALRDLPDVLARRADDGIDLDRGLDRLGVRILRRSDAEAVRTVAAHHGLQPSHEQRGHR